MGFHYVPTDVVAENNQTYRLGFSEMKKDSTKMGAGIPEEVWLFRKAPTSSDNAYADQPVTVENGYNLSNWQMDADAFWKSSGNRYLKPDELKTFGSHKALLDSIEEAGKLSRTFTTLPMRSNTDFVWNDVNRMQGLNLEQSRRKQQNHICPMPFDQVDRLIKLYSNPDELVADPFGGLCTTGIRAIKHGRRAILTELNETYAKCGSVYLKEEEGKVNIPTLFDTIEM
jgi:DNA modification methylase